MGIYSFAVFCVILIIFNRLIYFGNIGLRNYCRTLNYFHDESSFSIIIAYCSRIHDEIVTCIKTRNSIIIARICRRYSNFS